MVHFFKLLEKIYIEVLLIVFGSWLCCEHLYNSLSYYMIATTIESHNDRINKGNVTLGGLFISPSARIKSLLLYPNTSDNVSSSFRIAIIYQEGLGDKFSALKFQQAATQLGWDSLVLGNLTPFRKFRQLAAIVDRQFSLALHRFKPDLVLCLHDFYRPRWYPHYLLLASPSVIAHENKGALKLSAFPHTADYEGFILGYNEDQNEFIANQLYELHKKPVAWTPGYHVSPAHTYPNTEFRSVFFCGDLFDKRRQSQPYQDLYSSLDNMGLLSVYGPSEIIKKYKGYKGFAPFEHNKFLDYMRESGISLVLHSDHHLEANIPSARIFEATSARTLVISDKITFIEKHFGDNILYLDTESSTPLDIQIAEHLEWIKNHPLEAQEKATRAYEYTQQHFSAEQLLLKIRAMAERKK